MIAALSADLAASREREGKLTERLAWYRVAVEGGTTPLRLLEGGAVQAPLRSPLRVARIP